MAPRYNGGSQVTSWGAWEPCPRFTAIGRFRSLVPSLWGKLGSATSVESYNSSGCQPVSNAIVVGCWTVTRRNGISWEIQGRLRVGSERKKTIGDGPDEDSRLYVGSNSRSDGEHMRSGVARTAIRNAAKRLGIYLRGLRTAQGWTQSELAEMVEVDAVTIRRWELGMFSPSLRNSERLADIYGVGVEDLMSAANVEPTQTDAAGLPVTGYLGTGAPPRPRWSHRRHRPGSKIYRRQPSGGVFPGGARQRADIGWRPQRRCLDCRS